MEIKKIQLSTKNKFIKEIKNVSLRINFKNGEFNVYICTYFKS